MVDHLRRAPAWRACRRGRDPGPRRVARGCASAGLRFHQAKDSNTTFQKNVFADLNGDGKLDYIIKHPSAGLDPGTAGVSPDTYKIEAYHNDGTFLWRKDLGWNMNMGIWWTPFVVVDFDGDGKAEVALKTAPSAATREASLAEKTARARGFVVTGAEYCSILDGMTGEEIIVIVPGEIRIYTTTIPTTRRRVCLLQDPLYRKDVALQTMGYLYPPQLSYHFR